MKLLDVKAAMLANEFYGLTEDSPMALENYVGTFKEWFENAPGYGWDTDKELTDKEVIDIVMEITSLVITDMPE